MLFLLADWLDLPLIWIYLAVCEAALRGVTSGVTQAMLPRALAADGSGNTSTMASTDGKAGCISTTGDAAHAHKLPKVSRLAILFFFFHLEAPFCAAVGLDWQAIYATRAIDQSSSACGP